MTFARLKPFLILILAATFALAACEPTFKKAKFEETIQRLAREQVNLDVEVAQAGRTLGLRFQVPDLAGEISSGNDSLYKKLNGLFLVLVRVALSSDEPPRFIVLDIVDSERPVFHLVFTRYVDDIRRSMAEAISYTDSQDRLLEEIVVGDRRVPFDPYEIDLVRLVMMSADAAVVQAPMTPFVLEDVDFAEFVAKVTENKARRILRERKDTRDEVMLREVRAGFEPPAEGEGTFKILLDLVSTSSVRPPVPLLDKILPVIAGEAGQLFKSYRFDGFTNILVVEKNTGRMFSAPKS